jgi:hypothetical protein
MEAVPKLQFWGDKLCPATSKNRRFALAYGF